MAEHESDLRTQGCIKQLSWLGLAHQRLLQATDAHHADWRRKMRLIHRHRSQRTKVPRIAFTQEEIAADLHYPASRRPAGRSARAIAHGGRR